jgi:probable rRNA maturation factor
MNKVTVNITNSQKKVKIPSGIRILIRHCCRATLVSENITDNAEVSVTFVDNEQIRQLNAEYRDKDSATDVLSFPLGEDNTWDINHDNNSIMLGDIVISLERAVEQAQMYNHSLRREIGFLTVHSMLHLLGYDHEAGGLEETIMYEKQEAILAQVGLTRDETYTK